jgi:UrcA family protein
MKAPLASLAAVAAFIIAGAVAAPASAAQEARIAFGDLDMGSPVGADTFDSRVEAAARYLCRGARRPGSRISDRTFCRNAVQTEAVRLLPGRVQVEYARSRRTVVL